MTAALFYLPPSVAQYYPLCRLDAADQQRLQQAPQLATRLSWQTSRVGKHLARLHFPHAPLCLSHKNGHSVIALGKIKAGVDLEEARKRNYLALAEKICSPEEIAFLHPLSTALQKTWFYRLWTLKEALIKAQDLRFPTDMPSIGLTWQQGIAQLRTHSRQKEAAWLSFAFKPNWILSAVWFENLDCLRLYSPIEIQIQALLARPAMSLSVQHLALDFCA